MPSSSSLRNDNSTTLLRTTSAKKSAVNFGLHDKTRFLRILQNATPYRLVLVHRDELSSPSIIFESTSFLEASHQNSHKTASIPILISQNSN